MKSNNGDLPAMPQERELWVEGIGLCPTEATGLTKREMFAMHAMQGILSNSGGVIQANSMSGTGWCNCDAKGLAQWSLECADALLAELEK
ncbi:hypothetical protein [Pseudoalteromonas phage Pq0]|uniref:hypothetical protein n=1 Tax=Pseudoalteromonas phage Pq0 TaxID=1667322 RepID=UPI000654C164|nr:hypothetical protein AXI74_gp28 [Pseudoalteromonas phage Pq0]AKN44311.1 hypothetical protein [Pseudoalteromonas phage Pq0]